MSTRQPLPNLTSIRLLAALYVFCYHFVPASHLNLGNTGVNLFFVLSGFILAYNHPVVPDKRRFYALRFARIYPLYALSLLLALPQYVRGPVDRHTLFLAVPMAFCLVQTWWPPFHNAVNSVAWTLPIEAFFYACFPFAVPWIAGLVPHWKRWTAILFCGLMLPPALIDFVLVPAYPSLENVLRVSLTLPVFHLCEFLMGMLLGLRFLHKRPVVSAGQTALAAALVVVCTLLAYHIPWTDRDLALNGLLALPYGVLLYALAGWRSRWFGHPLLQLGGEISFGIYLLQFSSNTAARILTHNPEPPSWLTLAIVVVASYLSYRFFETPARRRILAAFGYHASQKPIPTPGLQT